MNTRVHKKRAYVQRGRAASAEETRSRIVDAAVALHEELGPTRTTISAIAERAGVQRLTVYRHFPDDKSLYAACTGRWFADHPPPAPSTWADVRDPRERAERAIRLVYAYYRDTEAMWTSVYRDVAEVRPIQKPVATFDAGLEAIADELARALAPRGRAGSDVRATLRHALRFSTWQSLAADGLDDARAAKLAASWAASVA